MLKHHGNVFNTTKKIENSRGDASPLILFKAIVNGLVDTGNEKGRKSASMEMKEEEKGEKTLSVVEKGC